MGTPPEDMVRNTAEHDPTRAPRDPERSDAQLDMLHSLAAKLNVLTDTTEIGDAITGELRTIIDYHNCRVYLLQPDGRTLLPVAFRGELITEYSRRTSTALVTAMGEGITGTVAATRESLLTPDAREVTFSVTIEGTDDDLLESMLAVPMVAGDDVVGVIVLSSLGYGMFDDEDQRMLEVLASHAAVAFQSARLLRGRARRRPGGGRAPAAVPGAHRPTHARRHLPRGDRDDPDDHPCSASAAYVRDAATGDFRLAQLHGYAGTVLRGRPDIADVPATIADPLLQSDAAPFVIPHAIAQQVPAEYWLLEEFGDVLVCPLRWEPEQMGALIAVGAPGAEPFDDAALRLARGVGDLTALALGNARRISELERFHRSGREPGRDLLGGRRRRPRADVPRRPARRACSPRTPGAGMGATWGDHIADADRSLAVAEIRRAIAEGTDVSVGVSGPHADR